MAQAAAFGKPALNLEAPMPANIVAESIGINMHVPSEYKLPNWPVLVSRIQMLGVRHIRDGINSSATYQAAMAQLLKSSGARLDGITDCAGIAYYPTSPTSPEAIRQFNVGIGDRLESVEGPNEVDHRNDVNWAADTRACLPALRSALTNIPFIAPSIANTTNAAALGDISTKVDRGNIHRYFSGNNPGSPGWGDSDNCGRYGNLQWAICKARISVAQKAIVITETGYGSQGEVNEATQAKYLSRAVLVNLNAGIVRSYIYDLVDYSPSDGFGSNGLLRLDDSTKPAYSAIASEIALFRNEGPSFKAIPLQYTLSAPLLDHALFSKRDGTYILALWNETPSWNTATKQEIEVAGTSVTLSFQALPTNVNAEALDDFGKLTTKTFITSNSTITLTVDDHVTFLKFRC